MEIRLSVRVSSPARTRLFDVTGKMKRAGGPFHSDGAGSSQGLAGLRNAYAKFMAQEDNRKLFQTVAKLPVLRLHNGQAVDATGTVRTIYQGNWLGIFLVTSAIMEMKISPERVKAIKCVEEETAAGMLKEGRFRGSISRTVNLIFILSDGREVPFDQNQGLTFFD